MRRLWLSFAASTLLAGALGCDLNPQPLPPGEQAPVADGGGSTGAVNGAGSSDASADAGSATGALDSGPPLLAADAQSASPEDAAPPGDGALDGSVDGASSVPDSGSD